MMKIKKIERFEFSVTRKEAELIQTALRFYADDEESRPDNSDEAFELEDLINYLLHAEDL